MQCTKTAQIFCISTQHYWKCWNLFLYCCSVISHLLNGCCFKFHCSITNTFVRVCISSLKSQSLWYHCINYLVFGSDLVHKSLDTRRINKLIARRAGKIKHCNWVCFWISNSLNFSIRYDNFKEDRISNFNLKKVLFVIANTKLKLLIAIINISSSNDSCILRIYHELHHSRLSILHRNYHKKASSTSKQYQLPSLINLSDTLCNIRYHSTISFLTCNKIRKSK